jgi:hypothetical protein
VVDVLARLVGQAEAKVETAVGEWKGADMKAHVPVTVAARPAQTAQFDGVAGDQRPCVVTELELQAGRRYAVRLDADTQVERLARKELEPICSLLPDEPRRGDRRLAGAPLA